MQGMMKSGTKHYAGTEEAVFRNVQACKDIAKIVKVSPAVAARARGGIKQGSGTAAQVGGGIKQQAADTGSWGGSIE